MNTKIAYVFVTVLAVFALGAITLAPSVEAAELSGPNTYTVYVEVVEPNGVVSDHVTVSFVCLPDNASFAAAATQAFAAKGIPLTVEESSYGITMSYDGNLNIACWYADGDQWEIITDTSYQYVQSSTIGLAVKTGFISEEVYKALPDADKVKWVENEWGAGSEWAYMKCPDLSPSEVKGLMGSLIPACGGIWNLSAVGSGFKAYA